MQLQAPRAACAPERALSSLGSGGCCSLTGISEPGMMLVLGILHGRKVPLFTLVRVVPAIGQGETLLSAHSATTGQWSDTDPIPVGRARAFSHHHRIAPAAAAAAPAAAASTTTPTIQPESKQTEALAARSSHLHHSSKKERKKAHSCGMMCYLKSTRRFQTLYITFVGLSF